ncbi:MAG: hypothetical protein KGJ23_08215 [Euryarchaeota archaeon]|nr:hypothetical protein [Euryarchaeota archaeon]MDE1836586.1 hypothetical protein [Euryarchaeota archaeon]MDE1879219.1 hypothetical protein [Euryarchaeota archaeon]MDE2044556.1 hypothetical protein [Thermoplasmata archaeon]
MPRSSGSLPTTALDSVKTLLAGTTPEGSDLRRFALNTGRFYTHEFIGRRLAKGISKALGARLKGPVSIVDPFCGDGRLVAWFLEEIGTKPMARGTSLSVDLWDCDGAALRQAARRVQALSDDMGSVIVNSHHWDSFDGARLQWGRFDFVLTNPPWELLKPDPRQMRGMPKDEALRFSKSLREEDRRLTGLYPASAPRIRYAGWGLNLSRCGTEAAVSLLKPGGLGGIVVPASLFADNSSGGVRELLTTKFDLLSMDYFPSEAHLFPGTDQPAVSALVRRSEPNGVSLDLTVFDRGLEIRSNGQLKISREELERTDFVIPGQLPAKSYSILRKLNRLGAFAELEGASPADLVAGRELDETRIDERLSSRGTHRFVKGRMVTRFQSDLRSARFLLPSVEVPPSAAHWRIAWRDVSRTTQARRVKATLLPPGVVTGNSLSIAYFRDDHMARLKTLLVIMNSAVFEFQMRLWLATPHISLGGVRRGRLPASWSPKQLAGMARVCDGCLAGEPSSLIEAEVRVAQAYGLDRREFGAILDEFGRLSTHEKCHLLDSACWERVPGWLERSP